MTDYLQFDGFTSPAFSFTLMDPNTGVALNITGINIETVSLRFVNNADPSIVVTGTGSCALVSAALGQCSYQWTFADMDALVPTTYRAYAVAKVPGDTSYRAFDLGFIALLYLPGETFVVTYDENLVQVGGQNIAQTVPGGDGTSIAAPGGVVPFVLYVPAVNPPKMPVKAAVNDIADLATAVTRLTSILTELQGSLTVDQPTGTNLHTVVDSAASLPLPTGAATEATLTEIENDTDQLITNTTGLATATNQTTGNSSLSSITTNTGRIPAQGQALKAASTPVTLASDQEPLKASTCTKGSVGGSVSSVTILASNASRKGFSIYNDSAAPLYLDESGGTSSPTSYTVKIAPDGYYEPPPGVIITGLVTGIWSSAVGAAKTKELT